MLSKTQISDFINNSRHAIEHLFSAIYEYNKILVDAQTTIEEIENAEDRLSDLFMYRDQFSNNANHHYSQYMQRMGALDTSKIEAGKDTQKRVDDALANIGASVDSISCLAGALLQISKQVISLRYNSKPSLSDTRKIGTQPTVEIIWEGRNHSMHWEEDKPKPAVTEMLNSLSKDLGVTIELEKNNSLSIIGALEWRSTDDVIRDLEALI